ncbi:MAG: hypothetical protein NTX03_00330 [Bacteroidetes bacterium]|nr:hypothetical protein [Bacteroidota bacterium]
MKKILFAFISVAIFASCKSKDPKDFHGLAWGDSPQQVMEVQGGKPMEKTKEQIVYTIQIHGLTGQLGYVFGKDKLASAIYITDSEQGSKMKVDKAFLAIADSLNKVYGNVDADVLNNGEIIKKKWSLPKTLIELSYHDGQIMLSHTGFQFQEIMKGN